MSGPPAPYPFSPYPHPTPTSPSLRVPFGPGSRPSFRAERGAALGEVMRERGEVARQGDTG